MWIAALLLAIFSLGTHNNPALWLVAGLPALFVTIGLVVFGWKSRSEHNPLVQRGIFTFIIGVYLIPNIALGISVIIRFLKFG